MAANFDWEADRKLPASSAARSISSAEEQSGMRREDPLQPKSSIKHKPLFTRTSYWSTLQPGRKSYRIFAKQMTNPPPPCGSHAPTQSKRLRPTKTVQDKADEARPWSWSNGVLGFMLARARPASPERKQSISCILS